MDSEPQNWSENPFLPLDGNIKTTQSDFERHCVNSCTDVKEKKEKSHVLQLQVVVQYGPPPQTRIVGAGTAATRRLSFPRPILPPLTQVL